MCEVNASKLLQGCKANIRISTVQDCSEGLGILVTRGHLVKDHIQQQDWRSAGHTRHHLRLHIRARRDMSRVT